MAIYHLHLKPVKRSAGRSAVAAAAYRSGEKLRDERQELNFDYTRKQSVDHTELLGWSGTREQLWNAAELAERRKDSVVAREYEVAIPRELNNEQKVQLVREYGDWLQKRHGVAVDLAIHDISGENPHAHILTTTRESLALQLGDKVSREWSDTRRKKEGLKPGASDVNEARQVWAKTANQALERAGQKARIDHRSNKERGIERLPTRKLGAAANAMEKRGIKTEKGNHNRIVERINGAFRFLSKAGMELAGESVQVVIATYRQLAEDFGRIGFTPAFAGHQIPPPSGGGQDRNAAKLAIAERDARTQLERADRQEAIKAAMVKRYEQTQLERATRQEAIKAAMVKRYKQTQLERADRQQATDQKRGLATAAADGRRQQATQATDQKRQLATAATDGRRQQATQATDQKRQLATAAADGRRQQATQATDQKREIATDTRETKRQQEASMSAAKAAMVKRYEQTQLERAKALNQEAAKKPRKAKTRTRSRGRGLGIEM